MVKFRFRILSCSAMANTKQADIETNLDPRAKSFSTFIIFLIGLIFGTAFLAVCTWTVKTFFNYQIEWLFGVIKVLAALATAGVAIVLRYSEVKQRRASEQKIAVIEERAFEHPEKPQLAWDLARAKLESYLDRNLSQVRSIYWLTLLVMGCGFGFVLFGLLKAFDSPEKLSVSIVASASGVIISFIGGSFLFIYRSILTQSKDYVTVLERINAVGMAVQVIANIPEESATLKHNTTAELAKQLLGLYAKAPLSKKRVSRKPSEPGLE